MKKIMPIIIGALTITSSIMPVTFAKTFSDVGSSHWAYEYINELSDNEVINGYSDGTFKPSATITKAEYIKLLVSAVASDKEIEDLQNKQKEASEWYKPYYDYTINNKIMNADDIDSMTATVSRREMVRYLVKFSDFVGISKPTMDSNLEYDVVVEEKINQEVTNEEIMKAHKLSDGEKVSIVDDVDRFYNDDSFKVTKADGNAIPTSTSEDVVGADETVYFSNTYNDIAELNLNDQEDIIYASELGFINGYEDGTFKPEKTMTRAEVATIIFRFSKSFEKINVEVWDGPQSK